jgi:hypothetical protein
MGNRCKRKTRREKKRKNLRYRKNKRNHIMHMKIDFDPFDDYYYKIFGMTRSFFLEPILTPLYVTLEVPLP